MPVWGIVLIVLGSAIACIFTAALVCFVLACYSRPRKSLEADEFPLPKGKIYEPYKELLEQWMHEVRNLPHEDVEIISFDGLTLRGKYYEYEKGAPIELMMPGYRGTAERDLSGGVQRCFSLGHNAFLVDQRAGGLSDGRIISFGIKERFDCQSWAYYLADRFGKDVLIILTGISMGAATVMMTTALDLPENVVGVLADCGYTSPKAIIKKVIRQIGLPASVGYFFVRLGARVFGGFDLEAASPIAAMRTCRIPVLFVHGEADDYVPCDMSRENYEACTAPRHLLTVAGAGHGLSYPAAPTAYVRAMHEGLIAKAIAVEKR